MGHRIDPGVYALGEPTSDSPVFVTANYTLSFDALRSSLAGYDAYLLVLDTKGINVWCAAGKGTFGTEELVRRVQETGLHRVVRHRALILPQLGAPGVSAHEVTRRTRFKVRYGPVYARDLPSFLRLGEATPEMRRVSFPLPDRLVLIPVELTNLLLPMSAAAALMLAAGGWTASAAALAAFLSGIVLFPALLPWLPTSYFSTKGFILGGLTSLPFIYPYLQGLFFARSLAPWWLPAGLTLATLLMMTPVVSFLALNFTGSTPFTSRSAVKFEIATFVPLMAKMLAAGVVLAVSLRLAVGLGAA
ncbi:MAG: carbon monoxide dehydrogenase [Firmicutes bacterium]|nr:carbon monoxide dehydrogenase [Bacillota bacterium]